MEFRKHIGLAAATASANGLPGIHAARVGRHAVPNVDMVGQALFVNHKGQHAQQRLTIKRAEVNSLQVPTLIYSGNAGCAAACLAQRSKRRL